MELYLSSSRLPASQNVYVRHKQLPRRSVERSWCCKTIWDSFSCCPVRCELSMAHRAHIEEFPALYVEWHIDRCLLHILYIMHLQGLVEAVRRGDMGHVRGIMSSGLGLDAAPHPLPPMTPPLIEAVCAGHHDMVELFLDRKANLNARDVALGVPSRPHVMGSSFTLWVVNLPKSCKRYGRWGHLSSTTFLSDISQLGAMLCRWHSLALGSGIGQQGSDGHSDGARIRCEQPLLLWPDSPACGCCMRP